MKRAIIFLLSFIILCTCSPQDAPDDLPFDTFTDNRDGNVYKMVTIGD